MKYTINETAAKIDNADSRTVDVTIQNPGTHAIWINFGAPPDRTNWVGIKIAAGAERTFTSIIDPTRINSPYAAAVYAMIDSGVPANDDINIHRFLRG